MVLDEEALERMLRRQRESDDEKPRVQAQLTDATEDFEVYERPSEGDEDTPPGDMQNSPPQPSPPVGDDAVPAPVPPPIDAAPAAGGTPAMTPMEEPGAVEPASSILPPAFQDQGAVLDAPATDAPAAEPEPVPPTMEAPAPEAPLVQMPEPGPTDDTTPAPETPQPPAADEAAVRRPQVIPPLDPVPERTHAPEPEARPTAVGTGGGTGCRIALVQSTFNAEITDRMAEAAAAEAAALGAEVTHRVQVPGVYDLPLAVQNLARRKDVDAVVVVGAVIQGETGHDQVITQACATQLARIACDTETPIGFGVTGPGMTWEQAEARIGNGRHGVQAAVAQWQTLQTV